LYGQHRAARPADALHPLGYGRELYFWSFIVALLIFALGAGVSIFQGIAQIRSLRPIESPQVSYIVLAAAFLFEGISWTIALRQYRGEQARNNRGVFENFRHSKDPPLFMVLFEDSAALSRCRRRARAGEQEPSDRSGGTLREASGWPISAE